VSVKAGESKVETIQVPTAKLQVSVVDDEGKVLPDSYVQSISVEGPIKRVLSGKGVVEVTVLAGTYSVKATALGKEGSKDVTVGIGQVALVEVKVPGTAGIDIVPGWRIPLSMLMLYVLMFIVAVIIIVILLIEYSNWRRRRLMQVLAPPK